LRRKKKLENQLDIFERKNKQKKKSSLTKVVAPQNIC